MAQESNRVAAEEALLTALRRTSRRLYVRELTTDLLRATAVALIVPIALALWQLVREVPDALARTVMVVAAAGLAAYALWRVLQRRSLGEAAAVLDAQAQLRNELTTAEWFVRQRESDAWVDEQVARAGKRAEGLSVEGLVPFEVARPVWGRVAGLAALLIVLNLVPVTWTRELLRARPAGVLTSEELDKLADIRNLIDQAKNLTPEELKERESLILTAEARVDERRCNAQRFALCSRPYSSRMVRDVPRCLTGPGPVRRIQAASTQVGQILRWRSDLLHCGRRAAHSFAIYCAAASPARCIRSTPTPKPSRVCTPTLR